MKFYGPIGFAITEETAPGVWEEVINERSYYGDVNRFAHRLQGTDKVNSDINISNEISIIADPFAMDSIYTMRYVKFMNAKWKITSIDVQYPRLVLSIGDLYNETES